MNYQTIDLAQALRLAAVPLISAFIGWFTNALAVRMIFRPRRPLSVLGLKIQGLVPKRQNELARSIGHTVQAHLLSHDDVLAILNRSELQDKLDELIREKISEFLDHRLRLPGRFLGRLLSGGPRQRLEALLRQEVRKFVPELTGKMMDKLEAELDFQAIVEEKVRNFDLDRLEAIIYEISARELKAIELIGGVLGFVIGLIQVVFVLI